MSDQQPPAQVVSRLGWPLSATQPDRGGQDRRSVGPGLGWPAPASVGAVEVSRETTDPDGGDACSPSGGRFSYDARLGWITVEVRNTGVLTMPL